MANTAEQKPTADPAVLAAYYENLLSQPATKPAANKQDLASQIHATKPTEIATPGTLKGDSAITGKPIQQARTSLPIGKEMEDFLQQEKGVEYHKPIGDVSMLTSYYRADNPAEQKAVLDAKFGEKGHTKDKYGAVVVTPEGFKKAGYGKTDKPVALIPRKESGAHAGALALAEGPMVAGAIVAAPLAGPEIIATTAAVGLGSALGKAANEVVKTFQGFLRKTPGQEAETLANTFTGGALGELGMRGIGRVIKGGLPGIGAESKAAYTAAREAGFTPTIGQGAPSFKLLGRDQRIIHQLFGNPAEAKNAMKMREGIEQLLVSAGVPKAEAGKRAMETIMKQANEGEAGRMAMQDMSHKVTALTTDAAKYRAMAESSLDKMQKNITAKLQSKAGSVADVQKDIRANYREATQQASAAYSKIDAMVGQKVVPTQALKDAAIDLEHEYSGIPGWMQSPLKKYVDDIAKMDDRVGFQQMQKVRTALRDAGYTSEILKGATKGDISKLASASNKAFTDAESALQFVPEKKYGMFETGKMTVDPAKTNAAREAAKSLKEADKLWAKTVSVFDNVEVQKLMKEAGETGAVDPSQFVSTIVKPGKVESMNRVLQLVSPETKQAIKQAHFNDMLEQSKNPLGGTKSTGPEVDMNKLQRLVTKQGKTMEALYGRKGAEDIRKLAKRGADLQGKFNLEDLKRGDFDLNLRKAIHREEQSREILSKNWAEQLTRGSDVNRTKAMDYVFEPNNPDKAAEVIKMFGANSKTVDEIKQRGMMKILSDVVAVAPEGTEGKAVQAIFSSPALQETLNRYGRPTLEKWYGKETTDGMYKLASVTKYIYQKPAAGGALIAAAKAAHFFSNLGSLGGMFAMGKVLANPKVMDYLILGLQKPESEAGKRALALFQGAVRGIVQQEVHNNGGTGIKTQQTLQELQTELQNSEQK